MVKVTGVRFRPAGKVYYFLPNGFSVEKGDFVIVETARGIEFGEVVIASKEVEETETISPLREVQRLATDADVNTNCENLAKAKEAFKVCAGKIKEHGLDMKLIDVEYTFDRSKVLFYFVSENRIDFRDLVKDLAATFRTRIELRQVGIRDHARLVGGLGICGREFCCSSCMGDFQPVSIKMAKEQGLSLNPTKISGNCGKLLCCLKYEQEAYESAMKIVPPVGAFVKTGQGNGYVVANNLLRETVSVRFDHENETDISEFPVSEVSVIPSEENAEKKKADRSEKEGKKKARGEEKASGAASRGKQAQAKAQTQAQPNAEEAGPSGESPTKDDGAEQPAETGEAGETGETEKPAEAEETEVAEEAGAAEIEETAEEPDAEMSDAEASVPEEDPEEDPEGELRAEAPAPEE